MKAILTAILTTIFLFSFALFASAQNNTSVKKEVLKNDKGDYYIRITQTQTQDVAITPEVLKQVQANNAKIREERKKQDEQFDVEQKKELDFATQVEKALSENPQKKKE